MTRHVRDYYRTPAWCVHRLTEAWPLPRAPKGEPLHIVDPCAGDGALRDAFEGASTRHQGHEWTELDIHPLRERIYRGDFLLREGKERAEVDLVFMNPPYVVAETFVRRALEIAPYVVALLRLGFLASSTRSPWLRVEMPDVYVLPQRPSFTGDGRTDGSDYAWFVWTPAGGGGLEVLNDTPKSVRCV